MVRRQRRAITAGAGRGPRRRAALWRSASRRTAPPPRGSAAWLGAPSLEGLEEHARLGQVCAGIEANLPHHETAGAELQDARPDGIRRELHVDDECRRGRKELTRVLD